MIAGGGWRALYVAQNVDGSWDFSWNTKLDVICWKTVTPDGAPIGWVIPPIGTGMAAAVLEQVHLVTVDGANGVAQKFMRYILESEEQAV